MPVTFPTAHKREDAAAVARKSHDIISVRSACIEATDRDPAVVGVDVCVIPHVRLRTIDRYGQLQRHGQRALLAAAADCWALKVGAASDGCGQQHVVFVGGTAVRDSEITAFARVWESVNVACV